MTLSLGEIIVFLLFLAGAVYLFQSMRVRELALQAARRSCKTDGVQLRDATVSIRRRCMSRGGNGQWHGSRE